MLKNYIYIFFISVVIYSCNNKTNKTESNNDKTVIGSYILDSLFFDIEKTDNRYQYSGDKKIILGGIISTDKVLSGEKSVKVLKGNSFALTYKDNDIKAGQYYQISVNRYGKEGVLVVEGENSDMLYLSEIKPVETKNGWDLIKINFTVPDKLNGKEIKIYVFNPSVKASYFDNLKIIKYISKPAVNYNTDFLNILIDDTNWNSIASKRSQALKAGMLEKSAKDYVDAKLVFDNDTLNIKIRLKGDWLDHLTGEKWSFRIKSKNNTNYWKGIKKFSIQTPETRDNLKEWIYHKLLLSEGLLTTEYGFVPVKINGKIIGVYAYEEHFHKRLLESKNRREGPILKFSEDEMFFKFKKQFERNEQITIPIIESAQILTFGKKTFKNPILYKQFLIAQNKLYSYKTASTDIENIFDLDKVAKYYAITDLTRSYHSLAWHNQRFYYNPVIDKLEIIAFDGNSPDGVVNSWVKNAFFALSINNNNISNNYDIYNYNLAFFKNAFFLKRYIYYLEKYSNNKFIDDFFNTNKEQIKKYEKLIQNDNPYYSYDYKFLYKNAKNIRNKIADFKKQVYSGKYKSAENVLDTKKNNTVYSNPYTKLVVKPYYNKLQKKLSIFNYYYSDIKLIGSGNKQDSITNIFHKQIIISGYKNNYKNITPVEVSLLNNYKYLLFENQNDKSRFIVKTILIPPPKKIHLHDVKIKTNDIYKVEKNKIIFFNGKHIIKESINIPSGYIVEIRAGTILDFVKGASFISNSPIKAKGTKNNKIIITSSDNTCRGFNIIQAQEMSDITYIVFDNINCLTNNNYNLTGAVTFYESDVNFNNCEFINNHSEDALNVVRSKFKLYGCKFLNTYSDAFDSDFSNGTMANTNFTDIGNDAIDFSGSKCSISNCKLKNINDKAFSGGENSKLKINNCNVFNANIAFASKDKSFVEINNSVIDKCSYGLVAFTKKKEFGAAKISANKLIIKNTRVQKLIEEKSVLMLDSVKITGKNKDIAKIFYSK